MKSILAIIALMTDVAPSSHQSHDYGKLLKASKYTLAEWIDVALRKAEEGTPLSAEILIDVGDRGEVMVEVTKGKTIRVIRMNISDGKEAYATQGNRDDSDLVNAVKIKLTDAIKAALKDEKGMAIGAKFSFNQFKRPECVVSIFNDGKLRIATVDGETGKVASVRDEK